MQDGRLTGRLGAILCVLSILASGCVERRLEIRSEPSDAVLLLNGREVGRTPYVAAFRDYGVYEVLLAAPRCQRLRTTAEVRPPWYQWFPLDFFFECVWPFTLTDHQVFEFKLESIKGLEELSEEDTSGLLHRAEELRQKVRTFGADQ